ncbi:MAG: RNA polymerase sigma factor [Muribaculaceae bacterium]|nr:RNA polymerase sigma factor [Muribaculaceae bacterium]
MPEKPMDARKFKSLTLPLSRQMWQVAFSVVRNEDDASDIVQELFVKLWEHRDRLSDVSDIRAYCLTAVRRMSIDSIRRRVMSQDRIDEIDVQSMESGGADDVHQIVEQREKLACVETLIASLPADQQTVIRLSAYHGCSNDEIKQLTGFSSDNVRTLLSRGRRKLRELFKKSYK